MSELLAPRAVLEQMASGAARSYPIFYADDIERVRGLLESRGVEVTPIKSDGMVRYFAFEDPEGNFFNVCHFLSKLGRLEHDEKSYRCADSATLRFVREAAG